MAWHKTAFYVDRSSVQQSPFVGVDGVEVVHPCNVEAHYRTIGLGLAQQLLAVAMHRYWQVVFCRCLSQAADMVHVGVRQQQQGGGEFLAFNELEQLCILVGGLHRGVNDGALLCRLIIDDIAVDSEMIECELLYHKLAR